MRERKRLKLRPHYFWLGGIFILGGLIVSVIQSREPESTHAAGKTMADITYMQDMTPEICNNSEIGDTTTLTDIRGDRSAYTIRKHEDNNCWMTQNLRLPGGTTITTEDSDLRPGSFVASDSDSNVATGNSYTLPASSTSGFSSNAGLYVYNGVTNTDYSADYGAYYSWCAATAGCKTIDGANPDTNQDAGSSICPRGWKLPPNAGNGSYQALMSAIGISNNSAGSTVLRNDIYKFNYAGYYDNKSNSAHNRGSNGYYWSRTSAHSMGALNFNLYNSNSNIARSMGFSVRCVAVSEPTMADITYLQDVTANVCANSELNRQYTLIDRRDGKSYTVAKIADKVGDGANCWMTQNLQIIDKTLTSADSDLPTGTEFVLPATSTKADFTDANRNTKQVYSGSDSINNTVYYNWYTATAGSGNTSVTTDNVNVTSSICPKGWELPTGGASGQFQALATAIGNTSTSTWRGAPYNFVATGLVGDGGLNNTSYSCYWSRTSISGTFAYSLNVGSSTVYPQNDNDRYLGLSVRCVNNPDVHGLPGSDNKDSASADFSVTVNDAITLSSVEFSNSDNTSNTISAMPGQLATGSINVNVGSNVKYKITMNSQSPDLASKTDGNTNIIPAITTTMTADQLKTNYGWGVLKKNTDNTTDDTVYTGLNSQDQTFYTSDEPAGASKVTNFGVGVGVPPTIPADTYSTEVTITAIATE